MTTSKKPGKKSGGIEQPDFDKLFYKFICRDKPRKLNYEVRNLRHDLIYISSFLHDARLLKIKKIKKDNTVQLTFNRDCWELPYLEHEDCSELYNTDSELTITDVRMIKWIKSPVRKDRELWLDRIFITDSYNNKKTEEGEWDMILTGSGWRLVIRICNVGTQINFSDLKLPYLCSKNKKAMLRSLLLSHSDV